MKTIYRYAAGPGEEIRETVRQTDLYEYYKMVNAFLGDVIIEKAFQKEGNFGGERLYMSGSLAIIGSLENERIQIR